MARKSTTAAVARQRARERALRFQEREQRLLAVAERYEATRQEREGIEDAFQAKIARIREQAEAKIAEAREQAEADTADVRTRGDAVQLDMLAEGISRTEIAERLGISTREVVRPAKSEPAAPAAGANDGVPGTAAAEGARHR